MDVRRETRKMSVIAEMILYFTVLKIKFFSDFVNLLELGFALKGSHGQYS